MPERTFPTNVDAPAGLPNWGAIWAGTFTFVAIWSVFGFLGWAILASVGNPNAANPVSGMGVGIGVWAVILTIIAMFVAGRTTARLAANADAIMNGTVTFGLSVVAALIIAVLGELELGAFTTTAAAGIHGYVLGAFMGLAWIGFVCLFLGWLAAMGGALSAPHRRAVAEVPADQVRRAA